MAKSVKKEAWKKARKQAHLAQRDFPYYIFCEGERTEPSYFEGFKRLIEDNPVYRNLVLIEIEGCALDTVRVVDAAEKYVKEKKIDRGQIWCVYDKDSFPDENFNAAEQKIEALNNHGGAVQYHAAWSNECIEFWFILHFARYESNNHRKEYIKFLNEEFATKNLGKYQKNMPNIFDILLSYGSPKLATRYAQELLAQGVEKTPAKIAPGTTVYALAQELAKYLPEEIRMKF